MKEVKQKLATLAKRPHCAQLSGNLSTHSKILTKYKNKVLIFVVI